MRLYHCIFTIVIRLAANGFLDGLYTEYSTLYKFGGRWKWANVSLTSNFLNINDEQDEEVIDDKEKNPKKDTSNNQAQAVKIGDPQPEEKKKKGIFNKIFGKKDKKGNW